MFYATANFKEACGKLFTAVYMDGGAVIIDEKIRRRAYDAFIRASVPDWMKMSALVMRKWRLPPEVELEDIAQNMYISVWKTMTLFDPTRGTTLAQYLVYNAYATAKRAAHKARGVSIHGSPDMRKSRVIVRLDDLAEFSGDAALPESLRTEQDDAELERGKREKRANAALLTIKEKCAFDAYEMSGGSVDEAVNTLLRNHTLGIWTEDDARRVIIKTLKTVASRLNATI